MPPRSVVNLLRKAAKSLSFPKRALSGRRKSGASAATRRQASEPAPEPTFVGQLQVIQGSCQNLKDVLMNKRFVGPSFGAMPSRQTTCACHSDSVKGRRNEVGGCVLVPAL